MTSLTYPHFRSLSSVAMVSLVPTSTHKLLGLLCIPLCLFSIATHLPPCSSVSKLRKSIFWVSYSLFRSRLTKNFIPFNAFMSLFFLFWIIAKSKLLKVYHLAVMKTESFILLVFFSFLGQHMASICFLSVCPCEFLKKFLWRIISLRTSWKSKISVFLYFLPLFLTSLRNGWDIIFLQKWYS